MEYTIVKAKDINDLIKRVNEHISEGWIPQGGIHNYRDVYNPYLQAMIKTK